MNWEKTVFLAHASEDKPFVRKLYKTLKENGFSPWLDEVDLLPGVKWDTEILNVIKKSKFFIACISKNSITKDGYIQKELRTALSVFEQKAPNSIYLIPALIDNVEIPEIKVGTVSLADYHASKLYDDHGFQRLISSLKKYSNVVEEIKRHESPKFDKIREEISNGNTDTSIRLLTEYVKKNEPDYQNNITLVASRFSQLRNQNVLGLISQENYAMESNKIVYSILEMIKYLDNK